MSYPLLLGLLLLSPAAALDDKIDGKLLVGKWEPVKLPDGVDKVTVEFTKDKKVTLDLEGQGNKQKLEGTYKLDGSSLTVKFERDGNEQTQVRKVVKLTESELVTKDEQSGEERKYKKVK